MISNALLWMAVGAALHQGWVISRGKDGGTLKSQSVEAQLLYAILQRLPDHDAPLPEAVEWESSDGVYRTTDRAMAENWASAIGVRVVRRATHGVTGTSEAAPAGKRWKCVRCGQAHAWRHYIGECATPDCHSVNLKLVCGNCLDTGYRNEGGQQIPCDACGVTANGSQSAGTPSTDGEKP